VVASIVTLAAVTAGREVGGVMVCCPPGRLKVMVQGEGQTEALFASRMAWRSDPVPESAFVVTTSVELPVTPTLVAEELLPRVF